MAHVNRRTFLKSTGSTLAISMAGGLVLNQCSPQKQSWRGFKYAMCNESMRELPWSEQCRIIGEAGYQGVEIAAFTLVEESVKELDGAKREQMVKDMQTAGIECVGLHWLLAPPPQGLHFTTPDAEVRQKTIAYFKDLIDFCGDLGGTVMIFGSPNQRNTVEITVEEAKKHFAEGLSLVADHAQSRDVMVLIEPLDQSQTDVVNTLAEAKEIMDQVNHPAIQTMFDFHNTADETQPLDVLMKTYYSDIHHVHVQEMDGSHLGQGDAVNEYVETFQLLKDLQYDKWVSLEVFDFTPGGETIARESMKVLKEIEAKLS